ncbi:MAG: hypothetical protein QOI55_956 [Actinomycetota bacterium]|nr:hypothetical protein [Actinomycetota bacterium]
MTTMTDLDQYLDAVAQELADLPPDERAALLDDLREHLAEVSAETDGALGGLGSPQEYAAELRSAAGLPDIEAAGRQWPRPRIVRRIGRTIEQIRDTKLANDAAAFVPQLRPAWWVLRAYVAVVAFGMWTDAQSQADFPFVRIAGSHVIGLVVVAATVYGSVALGLRTRSHRRHRGLLIAANIVIVVFGLHVVDQVRHPRYIYVNTSDGAVGAGTLQTPEGNQVTNIYPYDASGALLHNVLLYDQDGRPIHATPQFAGGDMQTQCRVDRNGAPVTNAYPLTQLQREEDPATGLPSWRAVPPPAVQPALPEQSAASATTAPRPSAKTKAPTPTPTTMAPLAPCTP